MAFELPPLPYDYNALEPYIDEQTMHLHHDKHHQAYVTNLNNALANQGQLASLSVEDLLRHILNNLLTNAVKYSKEGEPVEFTLERLNGEAILRVQDRGIGIPVEDLSRIFGRFERTTISHNYGGLGLGLYIARQVIEQHLHLVGNQIGHCGRRAAIRHVRHLDLGQRLE